MALTAKGMSLWLEPTRARAIPRGGYTSLDLGCVIWESIRACLRTALEREYPALRERSSRIPKSDSGEKGDALTS